MRISDCSTDVCSSDLDRRWVRDSNMDAGSFGEAAGDYSLAVAPALQRRNVGAPIRAAMCDTSAMTIVLIALALYLLAALALVVGDMRGSHPPGHVWLLPALPAVAPHAGYSALRADERSVRKEAFRQCKTKGS